MFKKNDAMLALAVAMPLLASAAQAGTTIRVPQDHGTIQAAIEASEDGDVVLVAPGTYHEAIDFVGRAITVTSSEGAEKTIIDADGTNSVVRFHFGEERTSVLSGFTLQNGNATPNDGGGVQIFKSSPTIRDNIVRNSSACDGNGIAASFSSALIVGNHVLDNHHQGCSGGLLGGGIFIGGDGAVEATDNLVENNQTDYAGGGIGMNAAGHPILARNVIRNNRSGKEGGGVATMNGSSPTFIDNLVYKNSSPQGGGLSLDVPSDEQGGKWINNTVANNEATTGSELYISGFARRVKLINNIFVTSSGTTSVYCDDDYDRVSPIFFSNDVFARHGATIGGICAVTAGQNGNIVVDPLFDRAAKGTGRYALTTGSPAIDAGEKTAVPGDTDLLGHKRRVDGNGDGVRAIDLGAIEYGAH